MQNLYSSGSEVQRTGAAYRIGAVARLAGVPVTTLRVWESRYGAFRPAKSSGSHRLYAESDVLKARMLRQLTDAGFSISAIAGDDVDALRQKLLAAAPPASVSERRTVSAAVVGPGLAARVEGPGWQARQQLLQLDVLTVFVSLQEAVQSARAPATAPDVLLVRLHAVDASATTLLPQAMRRLGVSRAILVYNYGAESVLSALRAAGVVVRRDPVSELELAELVGAALLVDVATQIGRHGSEVIPPRRYSDVALARIAAEPTQVLCECPRHVAELIGQLAAFEAYSKQCLSSSEEDARLHAYLHSIAGSARALFEDAMDRVSEHAGLAAQAHGEPAAA